MRKFNWLSDETSIWNYIRTNLRVSFAIWEKSERMSILVGALVALAFATATFWGFDIEWSPWAIKSWAALLGAWFACLVLVVAPYRMWCTEKLRADALEQISQKPKTEPVRLTEDNEKNLP